MRLKKPRNSSGATRYCPIEAGINSMTSNPNTFPRPLDALVMFDLDGTLIDRDYRVTDLAIHGVMRDAQTEGWTIGLSSDTPYEVLANWSKHLGIDGPIIAERGALVSHAGQIEYDKNDGLKYSSAKADLETMLVDTGYKTWKGNPVEALRSGLRIGEPGEAVVLINDYRRSSLGLFMRTVNEQGDLVIDENHTTEIVVLAREFYPQFEDIEEDLNHDYGILIVARQSITKRQGSRRLLAALQLTQFAMVGNSLADYVGDDIAIHYAVSDATEDYKRKADYVAKTPLATGASEILSNIVGLSRSISS